MASNQGGYAPYSVFTGNPPDCKMGRRSVQVLIDFTLGTTFSLDLSQVQSAGQFDCVQTLFVDLSAATAGTLTIQLGQTNQKIVLPWGAQAYIPVLQGSVLQMRFTISTGTPIVPIQLMNFFVPPAVWYPPGFPVTDLTLAAVISNGGVNVNATPVTVSNPTVHSGTITTGGTPQTLMVANAARKRFVISNPSTATEVLQFAFGAAANGYINLTPGTTWNDADFSVSGDLIVVNAATTGHAFTAYEW